MSAEKGFHIDVLDLVVIELYGLCKDRVHRRYRGLWESMVRIVEGGQSSAGSRKIAVGRRFCRLSNSHGL